MKHAWEMRNAYEILVGKPEGKKSLGRRRVYMGRCGLDAYGSG
jgi:hypothetical protein